MNGTSFDDLQSNDGTPRNDQPIWMMDLDDPKNDPKILDWLNAEFKYLQSESEDRVREIKTNMARYKGVQYQVMDTRSGNRDREQERAKFSPKVVINLAANMTEQRVAQLVKFKPVVQILPQHDEIKDKTSAKISKSFLDYIQQVQQYEAKNMKVIRMAEVCGEGYLDIKWNPDAGKLHPDYDPEAKSPLLDDKGQEVKGESGESVKILDPVHVGEVEYAIINPMRLFFEKALSYDDANYVFHIERCSTAKLKKEYPTKAEKIVPEVAKEDYNPSKMGEEKLQNETFVITFQHKKSSQMKGGRWIKFTRDVILENKPSRYDHGDFSFERMPGIEFPDEQYAASFFSRIRGPASQFNNLTNAVIRNQMLVAHPKWFVPRGTTKLESLGNDITVVQYQGGVPPTLGQQNPTPAEIFNFRNQLRDEIAMLSEVGDVLRGDPPAGITSGVALTFVAEQERQIANARIVNYNEFVRRVAWKTLQVCAQHYDKSDKRTMLILGKNAAWVSAEFDPEVLARPYDIRIQNSSALPDSKAARMQSVLDFAKTFPNMFPQEQVMEMLDLGQSEKYLTDGAAAARAAEAENEMILDGKETLPPETYESSLVHWVIHFKAMQDSSFKKMPPERQEAMKDHVLATEMLIFDQAKQNPAVLNAAKQNPFFPLFYTPEPPPPPPPMPPMGPDGMPLPPEAMPGGPGMPVDPNGNPLMPSGMGIGPGLEMGPVDPDAQIQMTDLPPEMQGPGPGGGGFAPV